MPKSNASQQPTEPSEAQLALEALRERADAFSKAFANAHYEKGEAASFIIHLCQLFELDSIRAVSLEHRVQKDSGSGMEFMDGFFPGLLLVEMKSKGKDLAKAYEQARGYVRKLKNPEEMPRYILVCDFQTFHLYDTEKSDSNYVAFKLSDLRDHVDTTLAFLGSYERVYQEVQVRITTRAANSLTTLHDALKAARYPQAHMQTFLVRTLFCLFAEDTDLFGENRPFYGLIEQSQPNGRGLGAAINAVFERLNTPHDTPDVSTPFAALTEDEKAVYAFPYVNGDLFAAPVPAANFDADTRAALLHCCATDWSLISPDIFGTMFQNLMHWDDEAAGHKGGKRRDFGAHYTSERNILRAIRPLFIDDLNDELKAARAEPTAPTRKKALIALYEKLPTLTVLDPACGCGNFLVVAYRELRRIEFELIADLFSKGGQSKGLLDVQETAKVNVAQFYGIELDPTAAEIATVAMWLTDHQLNRVAAQRFGKARPSIPLRRSAHIAKGKNALQLDWNDVLPAAQCHYIVGNPPFIGHQWRSTEQANDMARIWGNKGQFNRLDYVSCWYKKAADLMQVNPKIKVALVSTNSITQGEQAGILWGALQKQGVEISFAHRTFKWTNEGSSVAAVHCVIVGLGAEKARKCAIWDYSNDIAGEGIKIRARRINQYLTDAPSVALPARTEPRIGLPSLHKGSQPTDGGFLVLTLEEKNALIQTEPNAKQWIRPYIGGYEFINGIERFCLWLEGATDEQLKAMPAIWERVQQVAEAREKSPTPSVKEFAKLPSLFTQNRQPITNYVALPEVSSESRLFIPVGFLNKDIVASNQLQIIPKGTVYHFSMLCSTMHNAWMRTVCGRLESRFRYAPSIYNNFPWPQDLDKATQKTIADAGQAVLDARAKHKGKSLAWLYNPETMPPNLQAAHDAVDEAVDDAYAYFGGNEDAPRVAFLFERYQQLTTLLPQDDDALAYALDAAPKKARRKKSSLA